MPLFFSESPLPPASTRATAAQVVTSPHYDVQWNRPIFRAPALKLPSPVQIWSEIPFTAQFRKESKAK